MDLTLEVCKINRERKKDFYAVHSAENGHDWCNCVAWWIPTWDGWGDRTKEENMALREKLFEEGCFDGFLMYVDGEPAGWCQCEKLISFEKLYRRFDFINTDDAWGICCIFIAPKFRGRGLSLKFIAKILEELRKSNVAKVFSFPKRDEKFNAGEMWTGPESLYKKAGFKIYKEDEKFPVYTIEL